MYPTKEKEVISQIGNSKILFYMFVFSFCSKW